MTVYMQKQKIVAAILDIGIVPIVRTDSAENAIRSMEAVYNGGIRSAEITMTVPGAIKALEKLADAFGDKMILGAGTVLDPEEGKVYRCVVTLESDGRRLVIRGYVGLPLFGRTEAWTRFE